MALRIDASAVDCVAVLLVKRNGDLCPFLLCSRTWKGAEGSYHSTHGETTVLIRALLKLQP